VKKRILLLGICLLGMLSACWVGESNKSLVDSLKSESLYKIIPASSYDPDTKDDCVTLMPLDIASGFIHMALGNQVENVLRKFFKGSSDIILLELDEAVLNEHGMFVKKEQNKPGGEFFPHAYGEQGIPVAAVISVIKVIEHADGSWSIAGQ
jgi:uncharacterized protein (DUF952 family)